MKYKNKTTGVIVNPSNQLAEQTFKRSSEWVPVAATAVPKAKGSVAKPVDKMTTAELEALAVERGIDISECKTNAERVAAINTATKGGAD